MTPPSKSEVIEQFVKLIHESVSREEVATWARKWVIADIPPKMNQEIWDALKFLICVDVNSAEDGVYLFSIADFNRELLKINENGIRLKSK